ncbi:hypothetical protein ACTXGU_00190 [Niallia sp. 01092]|uniref:hypothetical protein n=1 Tax=Niallia sp. 01092 TaxID=3457759 RepID=UPI003FD02021
MLLNNIFNRPAVVEGVGEIYPIQLKDWDEFESYLSVLVLSKSNFPTEDESIPLLDRILFYISNNPDELEKLINLFNLTTRSSSFNLYSLETYFFRDDDGKLITSLNYEEFRKVVLHQNVILEPRIFKDPRVAEWAEKALKLKNKDAANITLEDMISTVSVVKCKDYDVLEKYTMYQLKTDFQRINQIKSYDATANLLGNPYAASEVKLNHFAEYLDLYADPYKDVFKKSSSSNINQAFK